MKRGPMAGAAVVAAGLLLLGWWALAVDRPGLPDPESIEPGVVADGPRGGKAPVVPAVKPGTAGGPRSPSPAARSGEASDQAERPTEGAAGEGVEGQEEPDQARTVWPASPQGIQGAVGEALPDILDCYQGALEEVPDLSGDLKIAFVLGEREGIGRIVELGITAGELEDAPMEDCVLDVFESLEFDPPEGGGTLAVTYPVKFTTD